MAIVAMLVYKVSGFSFGLFQFCRWFSEKRFNRWPINNGQWRGRGSIKRVKEQISSSLFIFFPFFFFCCCTGTAWNISEGRKTGDLVSSFTMAANRAKKNKDVGAIGNVRVLPAHTWTLIFLSLLSYILFHFAKREGMNGECFYF